MRHSVRFAACCATLAVVFCLAPVAPTVSNQAAAQGVYVNRGYYYGHTGGYGSAYRGYGYGAGYNGYGTGPYGYRSATAMFPYAPSGGYGYRYGTLYDYGGVREAYRSVYNPNFTGYYNPYRPYGNWQY